MQTFKSFQNDIIKNSYSILFVMRKSKRDPEKGTIYARLTFNKNVITLCSMGMAVYYKDFNSKKQETNDQFLNDKLTTFKSDVYRLIDTVPSPTIHKIRDIVNGKATLNPTMLELLKLYFENNSERYQPLTVKDWKAKINRFEIYLTETRQTNLEARQFGIIAFQRFKTWLMKDGRNTETCANKYGLKFRKALRWATMQGHITSNPLIDCELPISTEFDLTHLSWEWVRKLRIFNFDGKLKKAVDMYVFSCCTGICYADMLNLKDEHLENDNELGLIITNRRQKVKSTYSTPLWGYALDIYEEFGSLENIPKISNSNVNDYIKLALLTIGYDKAEDITFHTGRKTFVNYCLNYKKLEPHIIASFTGHQRIDEIKAYAKIYKRTAIESFYNN